MCSVMQHELFLPTAQSAEKLQQKLFVTKPAAKLALIECKFSESCRSYVHWYQKKEGEIKRILFVDINDGTPKTSPGFEYLKSDRNGAQSFLLKIPELKPEHSATYYCACWTGYHSETQHIYHLPKILLSFSL